MRGQSIKVAVRPMVESHTVVRRAASAWLEGSASTVFRALAASSWLGAGAALGTASAGVVGCVVKSGARHMLALRGESFRGSACQHGGLRFSHVSANV